MLVPLVMTSLLDSSLCRNTLELNISMLQWNSFLSSRLIVMSILTPQSSPLLWKMFWIWFVDPYSTPCLSLMVWLSRTGASTSKVGIIPLALSPVLVFASWRNPAGCFTICRSLSGYCRTFTMILTGCPMLLVSPPLYPLFLIVILWGGLMVSAWLLALLRNTL